MVRSVLLVLGSVFFIVGCETVLEPTNRELCEASDTCAVVEEGDELSFECKGDMRWEDIDDPKNFTCVGCDEGMKWASDDSADLSCKKICTYPEGFSTDSFAVGQVAPPVAWDDAFLPDGTQGAFSFEQFFCDEDSDKVALIGFVSTGWCPNCPQYMEYVAESAAILDAAGAQVVYWITQDNGGAAANNLFANAYVNDKVGIEGYSIRVGDATTKLIYDDGATVEEAPGIGKFPYVPFGFVIKRDNMKVVVDETSNDPDGPGIIYQDFLELLDHLKAGLYDDI